MHIIASRALTVKYPWVLTCLKMTLIYIELQCSRTGIMESPGESLVNQKGFGKDTNVTTAL